MAKFEFSRMGLKPDLLSMINEKGYNTPTPIQVETIPLALEGWDIMGQAQTGTGKTASFGIPILNQIIKGKGLQALILCPTRELAVQVCKEIAFLGRRLRIKILAIYGGQSIERQINSLEENPEIVVATPGRLLDHMSRKTISLDTLKFVVIDEADEMLDMGFFPDIERILRSCPEDRQTFLFSATLGPEVRSLGTRFMIDPKIVAIEPDEKTVPEIDQCYYQVHPAFKVECMAQIMRITNPANSIVFCRTKKGVDELARRLQELGYKTDALHGDMSQRERDNVMYRFRNRKTKVLIATDLAARGLDISHVTHVFNYDIPEDSESYVHRIGRTGRAGRTGTAITLVEPDQIRHLRAIERFIGKRITRETLDALPDRVEFYKSVLDNRLNSVAKRKLPLCSQLADELLGKYDSQELVSNLLALVLGEQLQELDSSKDKKAPASKGKPAGKPVSRITKQPKKANEFEEMELVNIEVPVNKKVFRNKRQIIDYITANTSVLENQIGDIEVEDEFTFIEIPMNKVDEVYNIFADLKSSWPRVSSEEYLRPKVRVK